MATPASSTVTPLVVPGTLVVASVIPNPVEPTVSVGTFTTGQEAGTSALSGE